MILLALYLLATLDAAFAGYRAAAGRSALIRKRSYYTHAVAQGALWGQVAVLAAGAVLVTTLLLAPDRAALSQEYQAAGARMLMVYVPFAVVILAALAVRQLPNIDLRSMTSVLVFGPLTLLRPAAAVAGIAWGVMVHPRPALVAPGLLILCLILGIAPFLGWLRERTMWTS